MRIVVYESKIIVYINEDKLIFMSKFVLFYVNNLPAMPVVT